MESGTGRETEEGGGGMALGISYRETLQSRGLALEGANPG